MNYSQRVLVDTLLLIDTWGWFVAHRADLDPEGREILRKLDAKIASIERRIEYAKKQTEKDP